MTVNFVTRTLVAVGISAVACLGLSVPARAQASPQPDQKQQGEQKNKKDKQGAKADAQHPQKDQGRGRVAPQEEQARIQQQEQRTAQYRQHLDQQQRTAQQQSAQLQQQHRNAQVGFQEQYMAGLHQQQVRLQGQGRYNYGSDPYFYTPVSVRYARGGRYYETNQYGADLLRQAVNYGYDQGVRAGLADRQDRWRSNYENSYAYQDANYGYAGFYVDRADYNTYFREGFRRGYADGYNGRYISGSYVNGRGTMLGAIMATIINFESIR